MKSIYYIIRIVLLIAVLVGVIAGGTYIIKQFGGSNVFDTVKEGFSVIGDLFGTSGSSGSSKTASNEGHSQVEDPDEDNGQSGNYPGARHIVAGDVFEVGDKIYIDKSALSYEQILAKCESFEYVEDAWGGLYYDLFGNHNINVYKNGSDYGIVVGSRVVWGTSDEFGSSHWGSWDFDCFIFSSEVMVEGHPEYGRLQFPYTVTTIADESLCSIFYIEKAGDN